MPRQSRGRAAPAPARPAAARPTVAPQRPAMPSQQSRPASTAAMPANANAAQPPAMAGQQRQPGLFSQFASTAAGVAVGSSIGHAITGMFTGGAAPEAAQDNAVAASQQQNYRDESRPCDADARQFTKCLDEHNGNMQICQWYLDNLKACQEFSRNHQ